MKIGDLSRIVFVGEKRGFSRRCEDAKTPRVEVGGFEITNELDFIFATLRLSEMN